MLEITKEKLAELYHSMSNAELCKKIGISHVTLLSIIKKNGIPLKGSGNRQHKITIVD